jgi:hypothetical protein
MTTRIGKTLSGQAKSSSGTEMTALGLLVNLTLAIIPILTIVIVLKTRAQASAYGGLEEEIKSKGWGGVQDLVDDTQLQRLLNRIERVLKAREAKLCLDAFPIPSPATSEVEKRGPVPLLHTLLAVDQFGFASDPRFQRLCAEARAFFETTSEKLRIEGVYTESLLVRVEERQLFDPKYIPRTTTTSIADVVTPENRKKAMSHIAGRLNEFQARATQIQQAAVREVLTQLCVDQQSRQTTQVSNELNATEVEVLKQQVCQAFQQRHLPLLHSVVLD